MDELEPGPGKGVGQLLRVFEEAPGDRPVDGVHPKREVRGQHDGLVPLAGVVGIGDEVRGFGIGRHPLPGAGRALFQVPVVAEEEFEEAVVPFRV